MAVNTIETSTSVDMSNVGYLTTSRTVPGIMDKILSGPCVLKNVQVEETGIRWPYLVISSVYDATASGVAAYAGSVWVGSALYAIAGGANTIQATKAYDLDDFVTET